jgi:hypothetical protein
MADHLANVRKYDAGADEAKVAKIVKHLGIALRNRDSSMVSCSDPKELARVQEKWCAKKFGIDEAKGMAAIEAVCAAMKGDNSKSRVTFYYLVAKELGTLDAL